ncbi:MAG: response regulator, partial [Crocosphaera sp.]
RKYGGTGLGLTITQRLVNMMKGEMILDSQPGEGSQFILKFIDTKFINSLQKNTELIHLDDNLNQFEALKILVVDDSLSNRQLMAGYFAETHHRLFYAKDGNEALEAVKKCLPDLILLDLKMPNLDGWETTKRLKENPETKEIFIIILTASSEPKQQEKLISFVENILPKPVSQSQLVLALKSIFVSQLPPCPLISNKQNQTIEKKLDREATLNRAELIDQLKIELEQNLPIIRQTMIIRDLKKFLQRLLKLAYQSNCKNLLDYAQILQQKLDNFEIEGIANTIDEFSQVYQDILEQMN